MSGGIKSIVNVKDMLRHAMLFINAAESDENEDLAADGRDLLGALRKQIASIWYSNTDLAEFDKTFKLSGWENQGFRWCRDEKESTHGRLVMVLRIVEFDEGSNNETWTSLPSKRN